MGGFMTYRRAMGRNGIGMRKPEEDTDPYFRVETTDLPAAVNVYGLVGDLGRMERDYLCPERFPYPNSAIAHSPLYQAAEATGVDVETIRRVLTYVFTEQP